MQWYNPLSWFGKSQQPESEVALYCNNCNNPIDGTVAYYGRLSEIYHPGECVAQVIAKTATAHEKDRVNFWEMDYIGLKQAERLFSKGELRQASGLERDLTA